MEASAVHTKLWVLRVRLGCLKCINTITAKMEKTGDLIWLPPAKMYFQHSKVDKA